MAKAKTPAGLEGYVIHPECPAAFHHSGNSFHLKTLTAEQAEYLLQKKFPFISAADKKK